MTAKTLDFVSVLSVFVSEMDLTGTAPHLFTSSIDDNFLLNFNKLNNSSLTLSSLRVLARQCLSNRYLDYTCAGTGESLSHLRPTDKGVSEYRNYVRFKNLNSSKSRVKKLSDYCSEHSGLISLFSLVIALTALFRS